MFKNVTYADMSRQKTTKVLLRLSKNVLNVLKILKLNMFCYDRLLTFSPFHTVFKDSGIDIEKPLTSYCVGGMASCTTTLAALICGAVNVYVYHVSILFMLRLNYNISVNNFQSCRDGATASWLLPVFFGE